MVDGEKNPIKEIIVREEFAKAGVPYATVGLGVSVVGPAIITQRY